MKNHGYSKRESLGCVHSTRPGIWGLGSVSSPLVCASASPTIKWRHWSEVPEGTVQLWYSMKMMLLTSWGGVVETKAYTELGTEGRSTCVIRIFSICLRKNRKMANTNLRCVFSQRVPFSFFPSLSLYLYLYHLCFVFTFVVLLPLSLSSLFQVFLPFILSCLPPFPIHLMNISSLKRHPLLLMTGN